MKFVIRNYFEYNLSIIIVLQTLFFADNKCSLIIDKDRIATASVGDHDWVNLENFVYFQRTTFL